MEETQRLREQAEKARAEAEKAKAEAKRVKDEAEQHGYDVGVAGTEDALRAEVPAICRAYYAQIWEEALNRAGIDASSELRRSENIFLPPAIQAPVSASSQKEAALQSPSHPRMLSFRILPHPISISRSKNPKFHRAPPRTK